METGRLDTDPMVPFFPRVGLESRGCKREPPKVPDVGAGDSEGKRVGVMPEGSREERREAESGLRRLAGVPPPRAHPSPTAGALDRNNKKISTSLARRPVLP